MSSSEKKMNMVSLNVLLWRYKGRLVECGGLLTTISTTIRIEMLVNKNVSKRALMRLLV